MNIEPSGQNGLTSQQEQLRTQAALEQAAMHAVRLATIRWTSGHSYAELELARALAPSPQARWHATAQAGFAAWMSAGGFAQAEPEPQPAPLPATTADDAAAAAQAGLPRETGFTCTA